MMLVWFVVIQLLTAGYVYFFSASAQLLYPSITVGCNSLHQLDCVGRELWMRTAIVNASMLLALIVLSFSRVFSLQFDRSSAIIVLIALAASHYYMLAFVSNDTVNNVASVVYIGAIVWLVFQSICVIELAHQLHRYIIVVADKQHRELGFKDAMKWYTLHIVLSLTTILSSIYFMDILMDSTDSLQSCSLLNVVFHCTYWLGVTLSLVSLATVANKGLLVPGTIFLYSVALCWYAQLSYPDLMCNVSASSNYSLEKIGSVIVFGLVFLVCLYACVVCRILSESFRLFSETYGICQLLGIVWNDTALPSNSFYGDVEGGNVRGASPDQPSKDSTMSESVKRESPSSSLHSSWLDKDDVSLSAPVAGETSLLLGIRNGVVESEIWKNHCRNSSTERNDLFVLLTASCYMPMLVSNWGNYNGTPEVTNTSTGLNSTAYCVKLLCSGIAWVFFVFSLYSAYRVYYEQRNSRSS